MTVPRCCHYCRLQFLPQLLLIIALVVGISGGEARDREEIGEDTVGFVFAIKSLVNWQRRREKIERDDICLPASLHGYVCFKTDGELRVIKV